MRHVCGIGSAGRTTGGLCGRGRLRWMISSHRHPCSILLMRKRQRWSWLQRCEGDENYRETQVKMYLSLFGLLTD